MVIDVIIFVKNMDYMANKVIFIVLNIISLIICIIFFIPILLLILV